MREGNDKENNLKKFVSLIQGMKIKTTVIHNPPLFIQIQRTITER